MRRLLFVSMLVTTSALMSSAALAATSTVTLTNTGGNNLNIAQSGVGSETSSVTIDNSGTPPGFGNNTVTIGQAGTTAANVLDSSVILVDHDFSAVAVSQVGDPLATATTISEVSGLATLNAVVDVQQLNAQAGAISQTSSAVAVNNGVTDSVLVRQEGNSDALSDVNIDGVRVGLNQVSVLQWLGTNLNSLVRIEGAENVVDVLQDSGPAITGPVDATSNVSIQGFGNTAKVAQTSARLAVSTVDIRGDSNTAAVDQSLSGNVNSDIDIAGGGNTTVVDQRGGGHISVVTIDPGAVNTVSVIQSAESHTSRIFVAGDENILNVDQQASANVSTISLGVPSSNGNMISVLQVSSGNTSAVVLEASHGNVVSHTQRGAGGFTANTSLFGSVGNTVTVIQP